MTFSSDPLNPGGFLEELGTAAPEKPPRDFGRRRKESRNASRWQVWIPTGHRATDILVPLMSGDLTELQHSPTGEPELAIISDDALENMFHLIHVGRRPVPGNLSISVPEEAGLLIERIARMNGPLPIQRRNYCIPDGLLQVEHYDQVYFGRNSTNNATSQGINSPDAVPMTTLGATFFTKTTLEMGPPELYLYREDAENEYGIRDLRFGSDVTINPEEGSVLWLLLEKHSGTAQRSFLYRTTNSRYYRKINATGSPTSIPGGMFELIWTDEEDDWKWRRMFEHRGRVFLLTDYKIKIADDYNGITIVDDLLPGDVDFQTTLVDMPVPSNDVQWHDMCANGMLSNTLYGLFWYNIMPTGYWNGVARSLDHGITWTKVHGTSSFAPRFHRICAAGNFVGMGSKSGGAPEVVEYSNDMGETWSQRDSSLDSIYDMSAVLPDLTRPGFALVYILGAVGDSVKVIKTDNTMEKEILLFDVDFSGYASGPTDGIIKASLSGCQIWMCLHFVNEKTYNIYRSEDGGRSWKQTVVTANQSVSDLGGLHLAVCAENPDHAAAGF